MSSVLLKNLQKSTPVLADNKSRVTRFRSATYRQVNSSGNAVEPESQGMLGAGERREAGGPEGRQGGVDAAEAPVDAEDALSVLSQAAAVLQ